jgi:uncharacterized protein
MNRAQVLAKLNQNLDEMKRRFAVKHLSLFGSAARDQLHEGSDIDVLVEFEGPPTFDGYIGLKDFLEALFVTKVDLATPDAIKPRMRPLIEKDLIHVA